MSELRKSTGRSFLIDDRLLTLMKMEPDNEKIYFNLGMLNMDDKKFEQAKEWFDKAIEVLRFKSALHLFYFIAGLV